MTPEYAIKGKFPGTEKRLSLGSRQDTCAVLTTSPQITEAGEIWTGTLALNTPRIKGKITFERNSKDDFFATEQEVLDYLSKTFAVSYLKDRTKLAVLKY